MKNKILALLAKHPDLPTGEIVNSLAAKRSSVSKCLTRLVADKQVTRRSSDGFHRYSVAVQPSPASTEATATANS